MKPIRYEMKTVSCKRGLYLPDKKLLSRNYLFNFRAKFLPANNRISARAENSTDWKSALNGGLNVFL